MVSASSATSAKSGKSIEAPNRKAAKASTPSRSPFGCAAVPFSATARHSAAPQTNSPKTRESAGAPTHVFNDQSAVANANAVAAKAAVAIKNANSRSRTVTRSGASTGNHRYANHSALIDHDG